MMGCLLQNIFFRDSRELLQCLSFGRLSGTIFGRLKGVILRKLQYFSFREIEMCHFRKIEMCHFREIEISHFRDIKILQFSGDWNLSCSGDSNVPFSGDWIVLFSEIEICYFRDITMLPFSGDWNLSFREIKLAIFERLKCSFFGGVEHHIFGNWNVTFSGKEKIELSSFWKTESFIFFGRNHVHKKNWKSKPKTKSESKHTRGTTNVDRICHEIQPAS